MCVCVCVCVCVWGTHALDVSECTTKRLSGRSRGSTADAAAFQELYDVKQQRGPNNDRIHHMSFSPTFISGI